MQTLQEKLIRAREGDKSAENEIFQYLLVRFKLFAGHKIRDEEDAGEIAQQACITVLEKLKTEKFTKGFEAWAHGVLRMGIKNYFYRMHSAYKKKKQVSSAEDIQSAPDRAGSPDIEIVLTECLEKIIAVNPRYARILNLSYQGYKTDEICRKLNINANNFYVILNRARSLLWTCLQKGEI